MVFRLNIISVYYILFALLLLILAISILLFFLLDKNNGRRFCPPKRACKGLDEISNSDEEDFHSSSYSDYSSIESSDDALDASATSGGSSVSLMELSGQDIGQDIKIVSREGTKWSNDPPTNIQVCQEF